jgi:hypothetical protein
VAANSQVVDILLNSADPQGVDAVRLDSWTIHGGLNLHNAVSLGSLNVPPVAEAGTVPFAQPMRGRASWFSPSSRGRRRAP